MAHSSNIIKQVKIGNVTYDIHDAEAIHGSDLQSTLVGVMEFKGAQDDEAAIFDLTDSKKGHVWHATSEGTEWLCIKDLGGTADSTAWIELGNPLVDNHKHTVTVSGSNAASTVTGTVSVPKVTPTDIYTKATAAGTAVSLNTGSFMTGYTPTYAGLTTSSIAGVSGSTTASKVSSSSGKLVTTSLKGVSGTTSVINSVSAPTSSLGVASIAGVSGSTTASKATAGTAVAVAKAGTAVSIPNVTGNTSVKASKVSITNKSIPNVTSVGSASTWSFSVGTDGVLTISGSNSVAPTLGTAISASAVSETEVTATNTILGTAISVTPAVSNGNITPYTFTNVTVPKAATAINVATADEALSVVTGVTTGTATVATANSSATTVATGSVTSTGTGSSVITGVTANDIIVPKAATAITVVTGLSADETDNLVMTGGAASTGNAATSVKAITQPTITLAAGTSGTTGHFKTGQSVTVGSENKSIANGSAAAQTWTPGTITVSGPVAL